MKIIRYKSNPVLTKENVLFKVNSIFNPGAVKYKGKYLLVCRVEMPNGRSSFVLAESNDGYAFKVHEKPFLTPEDHKDCFDYVEWGIEDLRVTSLNGKYYLTYTGYSKYMPLVILAETTDFKEVKIHGPITEPSNKDCSLFPGKINGYYWKVDRPSAENRRDIWISRSPDLIHWGGYKVLMQPEEGSWEQDKIGASSNPIKTDKGWLMLYHGVRGFGISSLYKLGVVLLDLNEPWKVIGKSLEPILSPETEYERVGDVNNVVFSNGWIVEDDGSVKIYYSGADTNICVAETSINYLISVCR
ncbi:MAG TPA: glycosidase [Ignavibacteria bacterium]|nr:glycosidase [Ignavibacteria bacterium]